jgi:hypothetical protein
LCTPTSSRTILYSLLTSFPTPEKKEGQKEEKRKRIIKAGSPYMELTISRGSVLHVKSRHGVDLYFDILMPKSMKGWWKKWFYLRNDASTLHPAFTYSCPIPLPSWGNGVARRDLSKL